MRIRTTAGVLLAGTLALTGCSSSNRPDASKASTPTTAAPTVPVQDRFLDAVNAASIQSWQLNAPSIDELAAYPDQWCASLAQGHSVAWLFGEGGEYPIGQTWGTEKSDAYRVLVLAVGFYCPAQKSAVAEELRASGDY